MKVPQELKFTAEHEWVREEGQIVVCGITDFAQQELGDVVFVDLPSVGTEVTKGKPMCTVESVKAASDVYAPLSGRVVEINAHLTNSPEAVNSEPYGIGWFLKIAPSNPAEQAELLTAADYSKLIGD